MTDLKRTSSYYQKKSICVAAATLVADADGIGNASGNFELANLPPEAIITNAYLHTETASDAATSAALTLGTASGGAQILTGGNMKTLGKTGTFVGQSLTGTGKVLWANVTLTGAATLGVGEFHVVVEYLEYTKTTGEYTKL